MSDLLVRWVDALPDGTVRDDVSLFDDGTVERASAFPAVAPGPVMGWFRGHLGEDLLALARSVAAQEAAGSSPGSPRPQAGAWTASTSGVTVPLWDEGGAPTIATLRSLLAASLEAAGDCETGVRFTATMTTVGDERAPLLSIENVGSTPAWCTIGEVDGATATFLDPEGRALGFLGSSIALDGGATGNGLLVGWRGGDLLELTVRLARPDGAAMSGRAFVAIG